MSSSYSVLRKELNTLLALSYSKQAVPSGSQNLQQTLAIGNTAANSLSLTSGAFKSITSTPAVPSHVVRNGTTGATLQPSSLEFTDGLNTAAFNLISGIRETLADGTNFLLSNSNVAAYDYPALSFNYQNSAVSGFTPFGAYAVNIDMGGEMVQIDSGRVTVGIGAVVDPVTKQVVMDAWSTIMNTTSFNFNSETEGLYKQEGGGIQLANTGGNLDLSFTTLTFNGVPFNPTGTFLSGKIAMPGYGGTYLFATGGFAYPSPPVVVCSVDCGAGPIIVANISNVTQYAFDYALSNSGAAALNFQVM